MSATDSVLFTAGHGFYQFAISRDAFDRSLYYNLLLQPSLAIPDHYFLQGHWLGAHLDDHPSRDSWIETGLRNGFVVPYFRREHSRLSELLTIMEDADRRGFARHAGVIAERIDRTPFEASQWSSTANSVSFGVAAHHYLGASEPPMIEMSVDPDDFAGFWARSRDWVCRELEIATDRSAALLGSHGVLLSQLIQVSGERLLGADCGRISNVDELLSKVAAALGSTAERDVRVYYTALCELYNRSLADTILTTSNSPRWGGYVAAMDLWRADLLSGETDTPDDATASEAFDLTVRLPWPRQLRSVSGDVLLSIRRSPACDRYFESLSYWRAAPHDHRLQEELVTSLQKYSSEIMKQVGKDVGVLGLRPQFISKVSDISQAVEKSPGVVQGFLALGATAGAAAGAAAADSSPFVPAGLFALFCLRAAVKYYTPSQDAHVSVGRHGIRVRPDITITRV